MTIIEREQLLNVLQQGKSAMCKKKNEKMNSVEQHLHYMSDVEQELLRKHWNAAAYQLGDTILLNCGHQCKEQEHSHNCDQCMERTEEDGVYSKRGRPQDVVRVTEKKTYGGDSENLLILAESAELFSESEYNFPEVGRAYQSHEGSPVTEDIQQCEQAVNVDARGNQLVEMDIDVPTSTEDGRCHWRFKTPRLSQIRHKARSKVHLLVPERILVYRGENLHGLKARLTQVRHQARSKCAMSVQESIGAYSHLQLPGKVTRLSQLRRQARSMNHVLVQEGNADHTHGSFGSKAYEVMFSDNHVTERIALREGQTEENSQKVCNNLEVGSIPEHPTCEEVNQTSVYSEAQNRMKHMNGVMRLSHLRREARLGNSNLCLLSQGNKEILDEVEGS